MSAKLISIFVSIVTTLSFIYAVLFEVGWLIGHNALGLIWFFSLTDYLNTSIPTMLGMISVSSAYVLMEGLFLPSLLQMQIADFALVLKNPRWDREQMQKQKMATWNWVSLGLAVVLSGILVLFAPIATQIYGDTTGVTVAASGFLFVFSLCIAGTSILIHYLPTRPALIIQILLTFGAMFTLFGFMAATIHASTPFDSYRVTTAKGILVSEDVLDIDRGLVLIRRTGFLLVNWDQISSVEYRQRDWNAEQNSRNKGS